MISTTFNAVDVLVGDAYADVFTCLAMATLDK